MSFLIPKISDLPYCHESGSDQGVPGKFGYNALVRFGEGKQVVPAEKNVARLIHLTSFIANIGVEGEIDLNMRLVGVEKMPSGLSSGSPRQAGTGEDHRTPITRFGGLSHLDRSRASGPSPPDWRRPRSAS